jgi:predicted nucleotidyltransferase
VIGELSERDLSCIVDAIASFPEIEKAILFGSRAKGTAKHYSDLDIAVYGQGVTLTTVAQLHWLLEEESPLPYLFDVVDYSSIGNEELKKHIDRVGIVIFTRA